MEIYAEIAISIYAEFADKLAIKERELRNKLECGDSKKGYMISWDERYDCQKMTLDKAISIMKEDGMCMIFILENICIISTEQTQGLKNVLVLCDK